MIHCVRLLTLFILWTHTRGDAEVSCVFMESCILPCSFQGSDVVFHWFLVGGKAPVHAYFHNQDQLARQDQRFRHRTSLFRDQISSGNASLQITGVKVQDEGRYVCSIRGNKDSLINLKVDAPVRDVHIEQVETRITCSSEGIYPEPKLTWSTDPPSIQTLQTSTTIQQTEQQLYSISSSLMVPGGLTDPVYICTVRTRRNQRRTTLRKQPHLWLSGSNITIPCSETHHQDLRLVWRFNRQTILTRTRTRTRNNSDDNTIAKKWMHKVKSVSESGSLTLQDLSTDQEGTYTCELSDEEETNVTDTFLRVKSPENSHNVGGIVAAVVGAIVIAVIIIGLMVYICRGT